MSPDSLRGQLEERVGVLMPARSGSAAKCLLEHDLSMLLLMLASKEPETVLLPQTPATHAIV